jgi:hypothetical protein
VAGLPPPPPPGSGGGIPYAQPWSALPPPPPPPLATFPPATGATEPGAATRLAIGRIGRAVEKYRVALLLQLLASAVAGAFLGYAFGGTAPLAGLGTSVGPHGAFGPAASLGASALAGLFGLIGLILTLIAWIDWREWTGRLVLYGAEFGEAYRQRAAAARSDTSRTAGVWIASLVLGVGIGVTVAVIAVQSVGSQISMNRTGHLPASPGIAPGLAPGIDALVVAGALVGTALGVALYAFATRSLLEAVAPFASPGARFRLDSGRRTVLVGAALAPLGLVGLFVPYTGLLAAVPAAVLVLGYTEILRAYREVAAAPLRYDASATGVERVLG